eukprot:TRINITY_DN439_c2_g1_i5.p1 TRINITY_DN439_c2_g1~~TRINITY_DN439_c2_g1_i5.p1  ORF type:complete len:119 (+),score=10.04 TRINITY_DN439_c2_g1_i5:120-476(+)
MCSSPLLLLCLLAMSASLAHGHSVNYTYTYLGCFVDAPDRALPYFAATQDSNAAHCALLCHEAGYPQFGLQAAGYCLCGHNVSRHSQGTADQCIAPCTSAHGEVCDPAQLAHDLLNRH